MTYMFFTPSDLRTVDPRPAPSLDAEEAIVRELLATRLTGDDLHRALQALGLEDYQRTLNPKARDAWMRTSVMSKPSTGTHCRNNHLRAEHSTMDRSGHWYCSKCRREAYARRMEAKKVAA